MNIIPVEAILPLYFSISYFNYVKVAAMWTWKVGTSSELLITGSWYFV